MKEGDRQGKRYLQRIEHEFICRREDQTGSIPYADGETDAGSMQARHSVEDTVTPCVGGHFFLCGWGVAISPYAQFQGRQPMSDSGGREREESSMAPRGF